VATALHIVSLGCARNDVDAEELAARLAGAGFDLVDDAGNAEVVVVNTCGFIEAAKAESIAEILSAAEAGEGRTVVATGCLAERYGATLAESLPEAAAVVGFGGYDDIAATIRRAMAGERPQSHAPADRRRLPLLPVPEPMRRRRLETGPMAPLKIATGCDRRCAFCAIPAIRGPFRSNSPGSVVAEAAWLASQGVRELFLVSENTTAYGKDFGPGARRDALAGLLAGLAGVAGIDWIRLSYLQPAELHPRLIQAVAETAKVVPYFDVPFQHASPAVLKRMGRLGEAESFLGLLERVRAAVPSAGVRANFIVGFPGETEADVALLKEFIGDAGLDAIGVFAYSDEEGTKAAGLDGHLGEVEIAARTADVAAFADTVMAIRAADRVGESVAVLVEAREDGELVGRSAQQGPEDARSRLVSGAGAVGDIIAGRITGTDGPDWLVAPDTGAV